MKTGNFKLYSEGNGSHGKSLSREGMQPELRWRQAHRMSWKGGNTQAFVTGENGAA